MKNSPKAEKPIKYMVHPVSAADKADAIKGGFRIVDAQFDPAPSKPAKASKATKKAD